MIGVGGGAGSDHPGKISGGDGIRGRAAKSLSGILAFNPALWQRQTAGTHCAVFTADSLEADGTGFHGYGTIKYRFNLSFWARRIISWVAISMDASIGSASFGALTVLVFVSSAMRSSSSNYDQKLTNCFKIDTVLQPRQLTCLLWNPLSIARIFSCSVFCTAAGVMEVAADAAT